MITLKRITSSEDADFIKLMALYEEAFPAEERREHAQLEHLLQSHPEMYFNSIECDNQLAGLFVYWNFGEFWYLEHLAIYAEMRNKQIGQQVLDFARQNLSGIRLLEAEPADDGMAARRINYYQRNGYKILDKDYVQPSYDGVRQAFPLWVMGSEEYPEKLLLEKHINVIKEEVYYKPRGEKATISGQTDNKIK